MCIPRKPAQSILILFFFASMILSITGCNKRAYRRGPEFGQLPPVQEPKDFTLKADASDNCSKDVERKGTGQGYSLAFIEFDDIGEMWSIGNLNPVGYPCKRKVPPSQLDQALELIERNKVDATTKGRPLFVLAFVHGWHNNASPADEKGNHNLRSFERSLQYLSTTDSKCSSKDADTLRKLQCPIYVGVFLAWRGESEVPLHGVNFITYWSRRAAANRVGGPSMTEAVMRLALATKGAPIPFDVADHCKEEFPVGSGSIPAEPKTTFMIVGHSFGARVLEHAVAQPLIASLLQRQEEAKACALRWNSLPEHKFDTVESVSMESPLDLVALVNPANDAFAAKSLIEGFKRADLTNTAFHQPVVVSIKSDGDRATGAVMFAAQTTTELELARHSYDPGLPTDPMPNACEEGQLGWDSQGYYYKRNPGAIPFMSSHHVDRDDTPNEKACSARNQSAKPGEVFFWVNNTVTPSHSGCFKRYSVQSVLNDDTSHDQKNAAKFYSCPRNEYFPKGVPAPAWNNTPYYVMGVNDKLIEGHNDIFQQGLFELLMGFLPTNAAGTRTPSFTVQTPSTTAATAAQKRIIQ